MSADYVPVFLVMLIALVEYFGFAAAVGRARHRFGIKAPATSGNPDFERYYRVQMNTLEILVIFIPALWTFALFVSENVAVILGLVFVVGRLLYFTGYTKAADKRSLGFAISSLPMMILLAGGLFGAARAVFAG